MHGYEYLVVLGKKSDWKEKGTKGDVRGVFELEMKWISWNENNNNNNVLNLEIDIDYYLLLSILLLSWKNLLTFSCVSWNGWNGHYFMVILLFDRVLVLS